MQMIMSFTSEDNERKSAFETKVETMIAELDADFEVSSERYLNGQFNDRVLETSTNSTWSKTLTLKGKTAFVNAYRQTVKQRLYFGFYEFDSSENCEAAFEQILNCLGSDCQSISWGNEQTSVKTTPFIYLKTATQIVFCKIKCEHKNQYWLELQTKLEQVFASDQTKSITAVCGGSLIFND
jgi:hypothetical protein